MKEVLRRHHISFKNAARGIWWALTSQPNFRVHLALAAAALILGWYLGVTKIEITIIVFTIVLGLAAEMVNTSLEAMTDLITREWREEAKIAKDVSAGMMLVVAIGAVVVAIIIFGPYLSTRLGR